MKVRNFVRCFYAFLFDVDTKVEGEELSHFSSKMIIA